jgi:cell division protein FtsN
MPMLGCPVKKKNIKNKTRMKIKKSLLLLTVMAVLFFSGCRSKRMTIPEAPAPAPRGTITDVMIEEKPVVATPPVVAPPVVEELPVEEPEPIPLREERFTFAQEADRQAQDLNQYFVILGSFRSVDNANRFLNALVTQGFEPVILISESGLHRISIDSFTDEIVARTRVQRIRNNYPEYKDAWLLIRKR